MECICYHPNTIFPFANPLHEQKRNLLTASKKVITPLNPHYKSLRVLGLDGEGVGVLDTFGDGDLIPEEILEHGGHDKLMVDFFSSFEVMRRGGAPVGWKFIFEGVEFSLSKRTIMSNLCFRYSGNMPTYSSQQRDEFWSWLCGRPSRHERATPYQIADIKWKYIHQLVALNINSRRGEGNIVSNADLDFMMHLHNKVRIDMFAIYTARFEEMSDPHSGYNALGCASIITALAKSCDVLFNRFGDYKGLKVSRLIRFRLLDPSWGRIYDNASGGEYASNEEGSD